jgi:hypothetical protein
MKYLVPGPQGNSVFIGGALLLEEENGIQARWSKWDLVEGSFQQRWSKQDDGPANSHLRGLHWPAGSGMLMAERYRDGYDILIYSEDGREIWTRGGGEHPRLSPDGRWLMWENPFDGLTLTGLPEGKKLWYEKPAEKIRLKQPASSGNTMVVEGRHLILRDRSGSPLADDWFYTDPFTLELAPDGEKLFVARQGRFGLIHLGLER